MKKRNMKHPDTLSEWLNIVESMHPSAIEMGLERVQKVKERLHIHFSCPVVVVGGTNGKGSTCAMLQAIWKAAGYRTGVYTSPHIHDFQERVQIQGRVVSDEELVSCFNAVEEARGDISLTFFEFTTLVIMHMLADAKLDVVILEVGLGGRLDAVNILDADVAIVTNVAIDHIDYLGDTREKIGYEKAGIFRAGRTAICGDPNPPQSLLQHALDIGADLKVLRRDYDYSLSDSQWDYSAEKSAIKALDYPALPGKNQIQNATSVLAVIQAIQNRLPVNEEAVRAGLATVKLPGRFEMLSGEPLVILDVGHNPHAVAVLAENVRNLKRHSATHAVFGAMADKDIDGIISLMKEVVDHWYLANLPLPRAATAVELAEKVANVLEGMPESHRSVSVFDSVAEALSVAGNHAQKNDTIVVFGSFWVVAGATKSKEHELLTK